MAANLVSMKMTGANGQTLDGLYRAIALRQKELGETTENAVTATVIRALESVRAKTRVADPKKDSGFVTVAKAPGLYAGWRRGGNKNYICVRRGGPHGARLNPAGSNGQRFIVDKVGAWAPGLQPEVFLVRDRISSSMGVKAIEYYIVALSLKEAKTHAQRRHSGRVATHSGLAKRALGWLMHKVSGKAVGGKPVSAKGDRLADSVTVAVKSGSGFGSGTFSIDAKDDLNYAALALDGGPAEVDNCIRRAVNGIVGQLNTKIAKALGAKRDSAFDGKIDKIFPEVSK